MAQAVNLTPAVSHISGAGTIQALVQILNAFATSVYTEFAAHARRLNLAVTTDGVEPMEKPFLAAAYLKADLPDATVWEGGLVYVTNETGGKTMAFSDGLVWRRVQDRAVVS